MHASSYLKSSGKSLKEIIEIYDFYLIKEPFIMESLPLWNSKSTYVVPIYINVYHAESKVNLFYLNLNYL